MLHARDFSELSGRARDERDAVIEHHMRLGEDPAEVFAELPPVEDYIVKALHDDALESEGQLQQYALARLLAQDPDRPDRAEHEAAADRVDERLYRAIGIAYPTLPRAAWGAIAGLPSQRA